MLDEWLDLVHGATCLACERPGRMLCRACGAGLPSGGVPVRPTPCPPGLAPTFAAGEYADPLRRLVLSHKEHGAFSLARPLGDLLAGVVDHVLEAAPPARIVLVPVPSRPGVVRSRGHDPLLRLVRRAARRLRPRHDATVVRLLRQWRAPEDQAGLSSALRAANLSGTLVAHGPVVGALARAATPHLIVLCDDVITTGSTVREAQRALESAGVRVHAIACVAATRKRHEPVLPLSRGGG